MSGPVVGVVCYSLPAGDRPAAQAVGRKYTAALRTAGLVPWLIPLAPDDPALLAAVADRIDGLMLTGGPDVAPARYGESPHPMLGATDPDRDATEFEMVRLAGERKLPVFAICRGLQLLNVAHGGTLYQDIRDQVPAALLHDRYPLSEYPERDAIAHDVSVAPGCRLAEILGESVVPVNSLHHQAVKDVGAGLRATAYAPDGVVEGVEGTGGRFVVAVQWHPEELVDAHGPMRRLFAAFAAACAT